MRLFNENVVPKHTELPYNIIRSEKIQEHFLDMFLVCLNGTDYLVEKIGSYGKDPIVLIPVILDDQQYEYPFILITGKQEILFNSDNGGIPTYQEKVEEPIVDIEIVEEFEAEFDIEDEEDEEILEEVVYNEGSDSVLSENPTQDVKQIEYVIESRKKPKSKDKDVDDIEKIINKKISAKIATEVLNMRKYVASWGGGGGTVAMQFADGGTMGGDLTVTGTISASNYAGTIGDDIDVSTKVRASSASWDSTYNTVTNLSSTWGAGTPAGSSYDLQYNNSGAFGAIPSNANSTTLYLTQRGDGTSSFVPSWEPLPQLGTVTYFFQPTISNVLSYNRMASTAYPTITSITKTGVANGQLLATFITDLNTPNREFIPDGQYSCHIHAYKSAGTKDSFLRAEVWEVDSSGVDISNIALLGNSAILTNISTELFIAESLDRYDLAGTTSRIAVKLYAVITGGGSAPTITLDMGDGTDSRLNLPAPIVDVTNYVPYSGAISNLDLGSNNLSASSANLNHLVVSGDVEIATSSDGLILKSPDGARWRITIDNTGAVTTTSI